MKKHSSAPAASDPYGFDSEEQRQSWRQSVFEDTTDNEEVYSLAFRLARRSASPSENVDETDMAASVRYLEVCMARFSDAELGNITLRKAASLWARGALGASRYRRKRAVKHA